MEREALIAERLLAWDNESNALAPLTETQLKSIELLCDTSDDRPFPTEVSFLLVFNILKSLHTFLYFYSLILNSVILHTAS